VKAVSNRLRASVTRAWIWADLIFCFRRYLDWAELNCPLGRLLEYDRPEDLLALLVRLAPVGSPFSSMLVGGPHRVGVVVVYRQPF
jgi:hypothetical protein